MSQTPQPSAASIVLREKQQRRLKHRRRAVAGLVVVFLLLIGFFVLPPIVKWQAVKRLSAELNREVAIERLRINFFKLSVTIDGLDIRDRDGGPFTSWKRLYVNFNSLSFFTGEWRFDKIALDGFSQRVAIAEDGTFNFADLIPARGEPDVASPEPGRPIRIEQLTVTGAAVAFSDRSREQPFETDLGPLTFRLENFLTAGDPKAPYQFSAATEAGESFSWRGTVSIDPIRSAGEFSLGKIALKKYAPYYAGFVNADLLDGSLDVIARYSIDLADATRELTLVDAQVKLSHLQVAARGSTEPLIDLPLISIDGLSANGLTASATIERIAVEGGRLVVVREKDGSINLLKLLPPAATDALAVDESAAGQPADAPPVDPAAVPDVKLAAFALSGVAIDFEDRTTPTPAKFGVGDLEVALKNFSLADPAMPVLVKVSANTLPGGVFKVEGTATREPLSADLQVAVDALPLAAAMPYIEPLANLRITGGTLSTDGFVRLNGTVAEFQGNLVVDRLATVDGVKREALVQFAKLEVRGIEAVSEPLNAKVVEIRLVDPLARLVVFADGSTNIGQIMPEGDPAEDATSSDESASASPAWALGKFTLSNGRVALADRSIRPEVHMSLDQVSGTVMGLSSASEEPADVHLQGKVNKAGTVSLAGQFALGALNRDPGAPIELALEVAGVDLSALSPYVAKYAGFELVRSGLNVDVDARIARRAIDSQNKIVLQQFTLGAPTNSPEATTLPVKLGVSLLKNREGNIVLEVPVQGDLDDPEFKIGGVVTKVIKNVLVKAATSPFSLLGAAFGGGDGADGEDLATQTFTPGTADLAEGELRKTETLRKALLDRPALNLDITGSFAPEVDRAALRELTLDKQVRFRRRDELRRENPNTPPPAEITVSPEAERRILGTFLAERYPGGTPTVREDGTLEPPPPRFVSLPQAEVAKPAPRGPFLRRSQRVFGSASAARPVRDTASPQASAKPVELAGSDAADDESADSAAPITVEAARQALTAGIPVNDEDLRQLATERAQRVRAALLEGGEITEDRLFLTPPAPEGQGATVFLQLR